MGHSAGTFLWGTLVGLLRGTVLRNTLARPRDTLVSCLMGPLLCHFPYYICTTKGPVLRLRTTVWWGALVGHFLVGHTCGAPLLPPKVMRQVSKTSVSYDKSSKPHSSSLPNERFMQDFLQTSCVKSAKRAFRMRLPPKLTQEDPSELTHQAALPSSFAISAPPSHTRRDANPKCHSDIPLPHLKTRTKYCAYHTTRLE